jgi:preprotein translocase SecE subunit
VVARQLFALAHGASAFEPLTQRLLHVAANNGDISKTDTAVAQLAEQRIPNPQVAGSIPSRRVTNDAPTGFGLYKYGQGYWVRVLTAILMGTLILAGAAWVYSRLSAVSIPVTGYSVSLARLTGTAGPGTPVELYKDNEKVGTAVVSELNVQDDKKSAIAQLSDVSLADGRVIADAQRVRTPDAAIFDAAVTERSPKFLFPRLYLQAGVAGAILLVGAIFLYRYVGTRPPSVDFLIATDSEMRKVNWSTRKIIVDSTMVVIGATFLIAGYIFIADFGLSSLVKFVGLLQR